LKSFRELSKYAIIFNHYHETTNFEPTAADADAYREPCGRLM
jgi:hypothetical protein